MIKPNWKIFEAKFSENPQNNFEWFCSLLFSREFNKPTGLFRYKNQSAIENALIQSGDEIVGWQAKFYSASLSKTKYKKEIIDTLERAKRNYPSITKFIFYTNQEWGQNKGKEPKGKKDIEEKADKLGIKFEWRTASFFESTFVAVDNELIAKHFFSLGESIFGFIKSQQNHTENILNEIQTGIIFNGQEIKIDRSSDLEKIKNFLEGVLILSGIGGVGKTALIKDLYNEIKESIPFYVFKATEFELRNINEFFAGYSFQDFLDGNRGEENKIIVIDSAEKLLDLKNTDSFKEFLSILIKENWRIIFTTRDNYLEDLNYQFFEIYKIIPLNINIKNLDAIDLKTISDQHNFSLPSDEKLLDLIRNPFYLNEYLKFYRKEEQLSYVDFKDRLWKKIIIKAKPAREQCFLRIALQRVNGGHFFLNNPDCESEILDSELKKDGILGYESPHGYFITHDIYEEWALEKIIEAEFIKKSDNIVFFQKIGNSLPVRRAFRKWLSEKLLLEDKEIKVFIEQVIKNKDIESVWKDEALVSILLSDFSFVFFDLFKKELIIPPQKDVKFDTSSKFVQSLMVSYRYEESLLHKMIFLLRIACKEIDEEFFRQIGLRDLNIFSLKYVLTKPRGKGWESLIKFVFDNFDEIGISNIYFVLPIIYDWTSKFKKGETTRYAGLIALKYYQWTIKENGYFSRDDARNNLLLTIIYSSFEIKDELEKIFKEIIKNKWKNHRDPYYDLSEIILTKLEGTSIVNIFPEYVLQIADLFWSFTPKENHYYGRSGIGMEEYFNMEDEHLSYFPASAYQTPIYWLLQSSLQKTVDFILEFTNKSVKFFAKTEFAKYEVEEVDVSIEKRRTIKQYNSRNGRLWNMYRGTSAPAPYVLQSMHMALERFFLERGKVVDSKTLESWLFYLLKGSKSTSISAVVASIVLAYPDKTFNIAKILFKTKNFFFYDTGRLVLEQGHKPMLLSLRALSANSKKDFCEEERIRACDDEHRKLCLENLFLRYQLFRSEGVDEKESENRRRELWKIVDCYYKRLPNSLKETETDKTWRLYLARMDRRKMNIVSEETDKGYLINFNPEIEPELKEYSEKSLKRSSEPMKYASLKSWATYRLRSSDEYKQYSQYEENYGRALKEVYDVIKKLKTIKKPESLRQDYSEEEGFYLLNYSIPVEVCSVLVRDFLSKLSKKEMNFCVGVILEAAALSSLPNYKYQVTDGTKSAISVLPILFGLLSKERKRIKRTLLLHLFKCHSIDMAGTSFNVFSIEAIHKLWKTYPKDAQSLLLGYLLLGPKLDVLREKMRKENYKNKNYDFSEGDLMEKFLKNNKRVFQRVFDNKLTTKDIKKIDEVDLDILGTAFKLIPFRTENSEHKILVKKIICAFAEKIILDSRLENKEERIDYKVRRDFLEKLAYFVLQSPKEEIKEYLIPFVNGFNNREWPVDFFGEFILAEDYLNSYENFWEIWNLFKGKIIEVCIKGEGYGYIDRIIKSYLFAQAPWKETATEWHTLKNEDRSFFKEVSEKIGHCSSTLYAISKLLNDVGSLYLDDGVAWISDMLKNNDNLFKSRLEVNTIYYLENIVKKYIYKNREKINKAIELKQKVLIILDFLIKNGSFVGYMLRENIF